MDIKWEEGASAPSCRAEHTAVWLNELVYVGGDYDHTLDCYNPVNDSWSSIKTPYCCFALTTLNNKLLIVGGKDKSNQRTNQILTMDIDQLNNYSKMNTARSSTTAAGHQGMLIVTGGWEGKRLSSTELFDSNNRQWYMCNDLPQPHSHLQPVIVDNILYLLGGVNKDGKYSPTVFTAPLDTLSKHELKWNIYQDTPWCRSAPVNVYSTHLLVIGGVKQKGRASIADVYKLNKLSHSWEAIGYIPSARNSSAAVSTADNRVIVVGGYTKGWHSKTVWIGSFDPQS